MSLFRAGIGMALHVAWHTKKLSWDLFSATWGVGVGSRQRGRSGERERLEERTRKRERERERERE